MKRICLIAVLALLHIAAYSQMGVYSLNVGDFHEVTVAADLNVEYYCLPDSAGFAKFTCPKDLAPAITFSNNKGKLKVELVSDDKIEGELPTIRLYSLALTQATNWGDSTLIVDNLNPEAKFKAKVIGNGSVVVRNIHATQVDASVKAGNGHVFLTGKAQKGSFSIVSAGAVEAGGLVCGEVSASIFGTGSIDCNATEKLTIKGTGPGHVYYYGDPKVKNFGVGVKVDKMKE